MKQKVTDLLIKTSILTCIIFLISCGKNSNNVDDNSASSNKVKIAFVTNATADFWSYGKAGAEKAASEHDDIEIEFKMGDGTAAKQREICDALLVRGFKGIAISPPNPTGQQQMINDWANKASIITVDSDAPKSDRLFYLGTNNVKQGVKLVNFLKKHYLTEERSWHLLVLVTKLMQ